MRLWHQDLLSKLPQKQICGQWRECIALLGNGWGKKHSVVNYVFKHNYIDLIGFTYLVYLEMKTRGYNPNKKCVIEAIERNIRSKDYDYINSLLEDGEWISWNYTPIYKEHNEEYYKECIENLKAKGIEIE